MIWVSDGFVESFGFVFIGCDVFGVYFCFVCKFDRDRVVLCEGIIDFEIGVVGGDVGFEVCM